MFRNLTFNSVFWIILGLALFSWGAYTGWTFRRVISNTITIITVVGFIFSGLSAMLCGYTNGFTDHSPRGRMLNKLGIFLGLVGLSALGYLVYKSL